MLQMLISSLVGILVGVLIEDHAKRLLGFLTKLGRRGFYRVFPVKTTITGNFRFGTYETTVEIIDGNGLTPYNSNAITVTLVEPPEPKLPEVAYFRQQYLDELAQKEKDGNSIPWNGEKLALYKYDISRTSIQEDMLLKLYLYQTDYYTAAATVHNLQNTCPDTGKRLGQYLEDYSFTPMEPYLLPNGLGVIGTVVTRDNKTIFVKRSLNSGYRPGEFDVSVVEGLCPSLDLNNRNIDFSAVLQRAFAEEICEYDPATDSVDSKTLAFVFDRQYNQWNVVGTVTTSLTHEDIVRKRSQGSLGKWEISSLDFINFNVKDITLYCNSHQMWDMAYVSLYLSLVYSKGSKSYIDNYLQKHFQPYAG